MAGGNDLKRRKDTGLAKGITIYPEGDDKFYENGARGKLMKLLYQ